MTGLMGNQGEAITLTALFDLGLSLKLYKNDYTPVDGSTEANFVEADFPGYSDFDMASAEDWTIVPGAPTEGSLPQKHFEANAEVSPAQTMYGYYFVVTSTGNYVWGERFDEPRIISQSGDYLNVTPKIQLRKVGE